MSNSRLWCLQKLPRGGDIKLGAEGLEQSALKEGKSILGRGNSFTKAQRQQRVSRIGDMNVI